MVLLCASHIKFTGRFDPSTLTTGFQKCDQLDGRQPVLCERNDWLAGKAAVVLVVSSRRIPGGKEMLLVAPGMLLLPENARVMLLLGNALAAGSGESVVKSPCSSA